MTSRAWILLGVLAGLILWTMRNRINLGLSSLPVADTKIMQFAIAIARAEGFYVSNSVPSKINNPGDLKVPGTPADQQTDSGLTVFETVEDGWSALYHQLELITSGRSLYKLDWTIKQMGDRWAPPPRKPGDDVNIPGAWAVNVARALGVSVDTPLRDVLT